MTTDQSEFTASLLDPDLAVPQGLVDPAGRDAGKRFDVYRNNVVVSLMDAMETAFPVVQKLIGSENFRKLASIFVRKHPPDTPLLMFYGTSFPGFLDCFEPLAHVPYLADVARLEQARRTSYHAADCRSVAADILGQITPDRLMGVKFKIVPSVQIVSSHYPIVDIWEFNMVPNAEKPTAVAQTALVTRPGLDVDMKVISCAEATFLQALQENQTLEQAYEAGTTKAVDFDLSAMIVMMLQLEMIKEIND